VTRGRLPQTAGSSGLNGSGAVPDCVSIKQTRPLAGEVAGRQSTVDQRRQTSASSHYKQTHHQWPTLHLNITQWYKSLT